MGLFDKLFALADRDKLPRLEVEDGDIVAVADGKIVEIESVSDPMFAQQVLGKSVAFRFPLEEITVCSPVNGILTAQFPTGHAFGVTTEEGLEILVHIGVDTVFANGDGFKLLGKKQGDKVRAGDPIVRFDNKKLSGRYDMSVILILTNTNGREIDFIDPQPVTRGTSLVKK